MARYYKQYENNKLFAIGIGNGYTEITKKEYDLLLVEIKEKADLVDKLYNGEISISDVKYEWQEEIQSKVNERIELEGTFNEQEISSDELYSMITEVL